MRALKDPSRDLWRPHGGLLIKEDMENGKGIRHLNDFSAHKTM